MTDRQTDRQKETDKYLHGIGHDEQVNVVKQADLGHLNDDDIQDLNEEHEEEFPNTADLQEH